jgi:pimeloyl-ACP methyl ester carboxylesterase
MQLTSGITVPRAVALVVIALLALALLFLRVSSGDSRLSVPEGAAAGDLILHSCSYSTEDGSLPADCGTLVVPENRNNPDSRLIALPVKRILATGNAPLEPIFWLEGGPGISNLSFPQASRLTEEHDVVLVGYRGIEGSSVLDCPEVEAAMKKSRDFTGQESMNRYSKAFADCAQRLTDDGVDLAGYSLAQRVDDLEAVRTALGYERINLLSVSVGTRAGMIYAWRHPESILRSVMIGVNPPGHFLYYPEVTDELIGHYSELCAQDDACSSRTDDLAASMRRTSADMPGHWLFFPIKAGNVKAASLFGLFETTDETAPLNAPTTIDTWLAADDGDASGFWFMSFLADLAFPESWVWGELATTGIIDAEAANVYYAAGGDPGSILGNAATDLIWGGGGLAQAWPSSPYNDEYKAVRTSEIETLLIGGTVDFATPARFATEELLPNLPNGQQVILAEFGHSNDFWDYQPEASTRLLTTFFDTGEVDDSLYTLQTVDFDVGVASAPTLAKILLGMMVGFALLAIALLAWMAFRVSRRGSFGRKTSIVLRTLSPLLLGLGGWFLAVMIALVVWPAWFIGGQLLAVLAMGLAIGPGVYLAWRSRDTGNLGLAGAMAGAFIGAWLGFNAAEGLVAVFTTLIGAAIIANLALIALDVAWDRSGRQTPPTGDTEAVEPT